MAGRKKTNPLPSSSAAKPPQEPADDFIVRWFGELQKYDDYTSGDIVIGKNLDDWPCKFALKLWQINAAQVEIGWRDVLAVLGPGMFKYAYKEAKDGPPGETFGKAFVELFDDRVARSEFLRPIILMAHYMLMHAPQKLEHAMQDLVLEAQQYAATSDILEKGLPAESDAKFVDRLASRERNRIADRLKSTGVRLKSNRGQHSKWTSESFLNAMTEAVKSLREKDAQSRRKLSVTNKDLLKKLARELHKNHPDKITNSWDAVRKLIKRLNLEPEWVSLKAEWSTSKTVPMDSNRSTNTVQ